MPFVEVWCLPPHQTEETLRCLYQNIARVIAGVKELGLDENAVTVAYPPDQMIFGLGDEIVVKISGLFDKPGRTTEVRDRLARVVGEVVKQFFPDTRKVEVFVPPFHQTRDGFWSSVTA